MIERPGTANGASAPTDELENWCYRNLMIGAGLMVVGLALTLTAVLAWWGIPLLVIGGMVMAYDIAQATRWMRQRGIDVKCPYCQKSYRVLPSHRHLLCDDCQKEIPVPRAA